MKLEKLSNLLDISMGRTPARKETKYWGKGHKWVSIRDLNRKVIHDTREEITDQAVTEARCKIVPKGTLLFSFKLTIGKMAFAGCHLFTNEAIAAFKIKDKKKLYAEYLYYVLKSVKLAGANQAAMGKTLNSKSLAEIKIPVPEEYDDQIRIANLLGKVEGLIAQRKQSLQQLDELLKSVFLDMFGDPVRNEKEWEKRVFRDVTIKFSDGPFGSNLKSSHYQNDGIRVVRLNNIGVWEFNDSNKAYVSQQHYEDVLRKHTCLPGDVLIGTMGDPNIRACLLPKSIPVAINKADCVLCRVNPSYLSAYYILGLLNNPSALSLVSHLLHGQTRTRVSMGQLAKLEIPLPPIELQNQFTVIIEKVKGIKNQYQQSLIELENIYAALSQKAFKGELDLSRIVFDEVVDSDEKVAA